MVVGILIALQVNNWNEDRLQNEEELKIIRELQKDLEVTLDELDGDMRFLQGNIDSGAVMIERIQAGLPYDTIYREAFRRMNGFSPIWPRTIAYENLKSSGIDLITNDSIRSLLTEIFGQRLVRVRAIEETLAQQLSETQHLTNDSLVPGGRKSNGQFNLDPSSFEAFRANNALMSSYMRLHNFRNFLLQVYRDLEESVEELHLMVEIELTNRQ